MKFIIATEESYWDPADGSHVVNDGIILAPGMTIRRVGAINTMWWGITFYQPDGREATCWRYFTQAAREADYAHLTCSLAESTEAML